MIRWRSEKDLKYNKTIYIRNGESRIKNTKNKEYQELMFKIILMTRNSRFAWLFDTFTIN